MRLFELIEPKRGIGVFTFGRMNPPTIGHELLVNRVKEVADKHGGEAIVFLSQTHKPPKDPLPFEMKVSMFARAFPQVEVWDGREKEVRTPYDALSVMAERFDHIIMVVGSDRVGDFARMERYAREYGADRFEVVSAGERDPDADGVAGMSASKARGLAMAGDVEGFMDALPAAISRTAKLKAFRTIRQQSRS
jgi:nicotinic acid mononucleotide adenylyltransferase